MQTIFSMIDQLSEFTIFIILWGMYAACAMALRFRGIPENKKERS